MNFTATRDLITDLLPVYLSGEASADTKALVQAYLRNDPELAQLAKGEAERMPARRGTPAVPDQEIAALQLARRRLRKKTWFLVLAIFFTFCTFVGSIGPEGLTWSWEISPVVTVVAAALAAIGWYGYSRTSRAFRPVGV